MRIVVTGASGFIGGEIRAALARAGHEVKAFDVRAPTGAVEWKLARADVATDTVLGGVDKWSDVLALVQDFRPEAIVHAAARVDPHGLEPHAALTVNILGTRNVFEAARLFGVRRVVYMSSIAVLAPVRYSPIDAAHPVITGAAGPSAGFYGASKVAGEALCFAYLERYGLEFAILRPSAVYGLGMQVEMGLRTLVESAMDRGFARVDRGATVPRDHTYCRDVATLAVAAVEASPDQLAPNRIFYAASGLLTTLRDCAETLQGLVDSVAFEIDDKDSDADVAERARRGSFDLSPAEHQLLHTPSFDLAQGLRDYVTTRAAFVADSNPSAIDGGGVRG